MEDLERRFVAGEVRADGDTPRALRGYAVVFHSMSVNLGGFREIILPEAVDRTLREALDVRALVDHDTGKVIGRTRAGTLTLRKDKNGLRADIDTADTTAGRDIATSVRRGDVSGMSFGFRVMPGGDDWSEDPDTGMPIRTVRDMSISEVSIVSFPAYPDTSVATRSLQEFLQLRKPSMSVAWQMKRIRLRT